jgi:hypothetical protein
MRLRTTPISAVRLKHLIHPVRLSEGQAKKRRATERVIKRRSTELHAAAMLLISTSTFAQRSAKNRRQLDPRHQPTTADFVKESLMSDMTEELSRGCRYWSDKRLSSRHCLGLLLDVLPWTHYCHSHSNRHTRLRRLNHAPNSKISVRARRARICAVARRSRERAIPGARMVVAAGFRGNRAAG